MESAFPTLLSWSFLAPLIIRFGAGLFFVSLGINGLYKGFNSKVLLFEKLALKPANFFVYALFVTEITGGVMLMMGAQTQGVSVILAIIALGASIVKSKNKDEIESEPASYILVFLMLLSLIITGPGPFSQDLPY